MTDASPSSRVVLTLLVLPVFVLVIDTTFMNVSITTLVADLDTDVTGIQTAITIYTLVMAAFMVTGGKLSRIWGPRQAFKVGLIVYGLGALVTAASTSLPMLIVGWSVLEGLGAALVLPAANALVVANFAEGEARTKAYGSVAAVAAAGAAVGPLVGGVFATYLSWRAAFASEVLIVIGVVIFAHLLADVRSDKPSLDLVGVVLSAAGLALIVFGFLQAGSFGWVTARRPVDIAGRQIIAEGGLSPLVLLVGAGLAVLGLFAGWERRRRRHGESPLIDPVVIRTRTVLGGAAVAVAQFGAQAGVLLVLPIFMQTQLGFSAFTTGVAVLPMSIALMIVSQVVTRMPLRIPHTRLMQFGILLSALSAVLLALTIDGTSGVLAFVPGMVVFGVGLGLVLPHLTNTVVSSVEKVKSSEASGLLSTGQNLGRSLGTALAGGVLISVAITGTVDAVDADPSLDSAQQAQVEAAIEATGQFEDDAAITEALTGLPPATIEAVVADAQQVRDDALRPALFSVAVLSLLALLASLALPVEAPPGRRGEPDGAHDPALRHG